MSNNVLNIHTCSDSCAALMKLIKYIASDGDLVKESTEDANESNSHNEVGHHQVFDELIKYDSLQIRNEI